jgi:hypothetical protein
MPFLLWYEMVIMYRSAYGTKWQWYEMVMVRNGNGTKWLWYENDFHYGTKWLWYEMTVIRAKQVFVNNVQWSDQLPLFVFL